MLQVKVILILILAVVLVRSSNTTFRLRLSRDQDSNIITLTCRNDQQLELQGATFFLNGSELNPGNYPSFSNQNDQSGMVTFKINRQLEGFYSCGTGQGRSSPRSLIVYPTSDFIIQRRNDYFAVAGDTAVLDCAVSPGALIHYYHVTWRNGSRTIFRQSLPSQRNSTTFPDSVDPRYRLDPMNLSLIIDNVRRSDSIRDYHCDLHVIDPYNQNSYFYMVESRVNISLTVLSPPVVTTLRPLQDTVRQRENAIFSCKAEGYPLPTISWKHNGMIVTDGHPDYLISQKNEGSSRVASDLRIFSVSVDKTGDVTCIATANTPEESRITFADHNASTSLTVLGKFQVFDVLISNGGDVIFLLELPAVYNQLVHLFIKYTDDNNSSRSYNRTTEIGFLNSKSIQYVEYSSQVSYDRFRVKAGLVSGGMLGPLTEAPGVYDKDSATLCDDDGFHLHHALVYGITPAGFLFLLCIVLTIVICVLVCFFSLKKDTHTPILIDHFVKNAPPEWLKTTYKTQPLAPDEIQPAARNIPSATRMRTQAQKDIPPTGDEGENAAGSSGAPSPEQQLRSRGSHNQADPLQPPLSQQQPQTIIASLNAAGNNSGTTSGRDHKNGGVDEPDAGVDTPLLSQQSVKSRPHVYYVVKEAMKEAFPERKYRRFKKKLRSTCKECKKMQ